MYISTNTLPLDYPLDSLINLLQGGIDILIFNLHLLVKHNCNENDVFPSDTEEMGCPTQNTEPSDHDPIEVSQMIKRSH